MSICHLRNRNDVQDRHTASQEGQVIILYPASEDIELVLPSSEETFCAMAAGILCRPRLAAIGRPKMTSRSQSVLCIDHRVKQPPGLRKEAMYDWIGHAKQIEKDKV